MNRSWNGDTSGGTPIQTSPTHHESPVRVLPPVLAGIRACKQSRFTFPCALHSGIKRPVAMHYDAWRLLTVAGAAHVDHESTLQAPCFPFNRAHEHTHVHQNPAILRAAVLIDKTSTTPSRRYQLFRCRTRTDEARSILAPRRHGTQTSRSTRRPQLVGSLLKR